MEKRNLGAFPMLTTERLALRQLSENDAQEIFLLRSDPSINRYLDRQPSRTLDDALEFIGKVRSNSLSYWAIAQKVDGRLIGSICLLNISGEARGCELGFELLTEHQGKGIMGEAAKEVIGYAVQTLGLRTIDAYTHKDNQSSINLLERLKFKRADVVGGTNPNLALFRLNVNSLDS